MTFWCFACSQYKPIAALSQSQAIKKKQCTTCAEKAALRKAKPKVTTDTNNRRSKALQADVKKYIKGLNIK